MTPTDEVGCALRAHPTSSNVPHLRLSRLGYPTPFNPGIELIVMSKESLEFIPVEFLPAKVDLEFNDDGSLVARSPASLPSYPRYLTEYLERWARDKPDDAFLAERDGAESRSSKRRPMNLAHNIRLAWRNLHRHPGFTAITILRPGFRLDASRADRVRGRPLYGAVDYRRCPDSNFHEPSQRRIPRASLSRRSGSGFRLPVLRPSSPWQKSDGSRYAAVTLRAHGGCGRILYCSSS